MKSTLNSGNTIHFRSRESKNRMLRTFGSMREEITRGWENYIMRNILWARHVTCTEEIRSVYEILDGEETTCEAYA
jgi:hypothetical protein